MKMIARSAPAGSRRRLRGAVLLGLLFGVSGVLSSCSVLPSGISAKADEVHRLFYIILWLAVPVFVFVFGMLLISVVRFRRRGGDASEPVQNAGNNRVLTAFFAAPLAIIVALLVVGEVTLSRVDHRDPHPTEQLVVTGFQWEWSAKYVKEGLSVTGKTLQRPLTMELPVDEPIQITLQSNDVIHEFYVKDLLFMKNAVPGHPNTITIKPDEVGTFQGQCAQYCGLWHSRMTLLVKVVPRPQFESWVKQQQQQAQTKAKSSCTPTGSSITLVAHQISWDKTCIAVLAGKPFQLTIDNRDDGIDHDFGVWKSSALKKELYKAPLVTGPAKKTFTAPALPAGKYYFQCDVHGPAMSGTLIVQ